MFFEEGSRSTRRSHKGKDIYFRTADLPSSPTHICIFEDPACTQFLPLAYFRPVYNLRCGITSLKEKIILQFPGAGVTIHCRSYLAEYMRLRNPQFRVNEIPGKECLFVNGRVVAGEPFKKAVSGKRTSDVVYMKGDVVVAARVSGANLARLKQRLSDVLTAADFDGIEREEVDADVVSYVWDVVQRNGREISADFEVLFGKSRSTKRRTKLKEGSNNGAYLLNAKRVSIGVGTDLNPGVVLDAREGPVVVGENVTLFPNCTIIGPAYIGDGSSVKVNAQIYPGTSVGPVCKIGGEVEGSIFHGYSNKQHAGFIGHSYVGAWVNMGAGTNNSDLKNNYGRVRVQTKDGIVDTGLQFVGLSFGDHAKTAINSMFNTGTIVGVCSNIFGFGFPPKYVPSFSWGAAGETFTTFGLDKAVEMAHRVMARRKVTLSETEKKLIGNIFEMTADERRRRGMPA